MRIKSNFRAKQKTDKDSQKLRRYGNEIIIDSAMVVKQKKNSAVANSSRLHYTNLSRGSGDFFRCDS